MILEPKEGAHQRGDKIMEARRRWYLIWAMKDGSICLALMIQSSKISPNVVDIRVI